MSLFGDASVHLALPPSHYFFPEIRRRRRPQRRPPLPPQIPLRFALPSASFFRPEPGLEGLSEVS